MYLPEVDGLRTVAVVPVILFHAGFSLFSGGFVGVDVFFVISGFLITGIIVSEIEQGKFSILRFYERRARRILPALFVVMLACVPFAWAWMLPDQLRDFGQSLVAVSVFASNVLFWLESGYFAPAAELKPLLHTWSLAIEEQYYVFFPLIMLLGWKRLGARGLFALVGTVALTSLALAEWGSLVRPSSTFYLIHTRAWELFAGSLCALYVARRSVAASSLWGGLGLAMILISVFLYDETVRFPSLYALLPVGGTCLVLLFAQDTTWAARVLATKPMVTMGLLSYSAYLWHQPLFAFARLRSLHEPAVWLMSGLGVLSFVLAYFSWRYVEAPFRKTGRQPSRLLPTQTGIFAASITGLLVLILAGAGLTLAKGAPWRLPPETYAFIDAKKDLNPRRPTCHYSLDEGAALPELPNPACVFGGNENAPRALVLGDSHADSLAFGTANTLREAGWQVEQATVSGCSPFPGFRKIGRDCHSANLTLTDYARREKFDLIVLGFRPQPMVTLKGYDNGEGGVEPDFTGPALYDPAYLGLSSDAEPTAFWERVIERGLEQYLDTGAVVVLYYPIPEAGWNVPDLAVKLVMYEGHSAPDLSTDYGRYLERNATTLAVLDRIDHPNLLRIRSADILCSAEVTGGQTNRCANTIGATSLYFDDDHLSTAGAALLMPALKALMSGGVLGGILR